MLINISRCYVFTATKLFEAWGLLFGDWFADRCSVLTELADFTELASRTITSVVFTMSENKHYKILINVTVMLQKKKCAVKTPVLRQ